MVRIRRFRHQYGFERPEAPHSLRNSHLQLYTSSSSSIFQSPQEVMKPYFLKYWKAAGLHTKPSLAIGGERSPFLKSEERESGKGKKEVKAKLVSYSYTCFHLIGEHVYGHAFIVMEQFKKKLGSH